MKKRRAQVSHQGSGHSFCHSIGEVGVVDNCIVAWPDVVVPAAFSDRTLSNIRRSVLGNPVPEAGRLRSQTASRRGFVLFEIVVRMGEW